MAEKQPAQRLDEHIAELEAVMNELHTCAACGKPLGEDVAMCPHCGTPVGEGVELQEKATKSLADLEKHIEETAGEPVPVPPPAALVEPEGLGLASAAELVVEVQDEEPPTAPGSGPAAEGQPEAAKSGDLEGFIAEIEAEVGTKPSGAPSVSETPRFATVRTATQPAVTRRSVGWIAAVAAGAVLYLLALALVGVLGKFLGVSVMVIGTVLVVAGMNSRRGERPRSLHPESAGVSDYVCPLCGTPIPARAPECPTCGALFEE